MKSVLITGGSRGIGSAMVRLFCERGYSVAFTYKSSKAAAEELSRNTGAIAIMADSESESDVLSAVELAADKMSSIDILINNAAISSFSLFTDISLSEWRRTFSVNLDGAFLYTKAVLPYMISKKQGFSFISLSQ